MRVTVVTGGPSAEAEVSRASAKSVEAALRAAGHEVRVLELDRRLALALGESATDVVFPVAHGAVGEDGSLQGLLEVMAMPYVGSAVLASAVAMDKPMAKRVFVAAGLPVARGLELPRGDARAAAARARAEVGRAVVVKPSASGSALAVARLEASASDDDVARAIEAVWRSHPLALVEHFVKGREITCSVLDVGSGGAEALAATEIDSPNDAFYTYEARYAPGRSVHRCPAPLEPSVAARVHDVAVRAHIALGCRDLSRADFIVGDAGDPAAITLLEVNTMPGFTATSLFPEAAAARGIAFADLCDRLVRRAFERGASARNEPVPLPA